MTLPEQLFVNPTDDSGQALAWDTARLHQALNDAGVEQNLRSTERQLEQADWLPPALRSEDIHDADGLAPVQLVRQSFDAEAKRKRWLTLVVQVHRSPARGTVLVANDGRLARRWRFVDDVSLTGEGLLQALAVLAGGAAEAGRTVLLWPHGELVAAFRDLVSQCGGHRIERPGSPRLQLGVAAFNSGEVARPPSARPGLRHGGEGLSHLDRLEAESMHIIREVMAQAENPVMLYSVGKDSSVMLHLARKAFYPSPPPFPLMHIDTRWKFKAMYRFRDQMAAESGMELIVHINPEGVEKDINPFDHGSALHTDVMKTQGLKQALDQHGFDVAFGGARRDEEKSRAKERVFSFRTATHRWDPKNQRPELWNLYNGYKSRGESIRVFPLSNWTELDIWQYIYREQIPIVPLYFAAERPVVERDGMIIMVDDDRMRLFPDDRIELRKVRFRTLGCYPLTGAFESDADDLSAIVLELLQSRTSERQGRAIDSDAAASMEKKKQEGYF